MVTLRSSVRLAALGAALCLTLDAPAAAQVVVQPASQPTKLNPYAGLRGAPQRGLPLRGDTARGVSVRPSGPRGPNLLLIRNAGPQRENAPGGSPSATPAATPPVAAPLAGATPLGQPGVGRPSWKRAPPERIRTRLITLTDGRTLRTSSQRVDGHWHVLTRGGWATLPAGAVVDAALEIEVLGEARLRRRDMDRGDAGARLSEVAWLLDVGLTREALDQLDELLQDDASEERAAALVTRGTLPDAVLSDALRTHHDDVRPDTVEGWLQVGARARPSVRELVVLELVEVGARQRNELERELLTAAASPDEPRSAFAALALRRLFPQR